MITGTLLAPDPPPEQIAQAKEQNAQLAKQAYPNLIKVAGGSSDDSSSSSETKRSLAGRSQGQPELELGKKKNNNKAGMRLNGGSASVSSKEPPPDKRAAMPQGSFKSSPVHLRAFRANSQMRSAPPAAAKQFNQEDGNGKIAYAPSRGFKHDDAQQGGGEIERRDVHDMSARGIDGFEYGKDPIRGVNIGGWLVREYLADFKKSTCGYRADL